MSPRDPDRRVVVGLDNGGTTNNATILGADGRFLVDRLVETPSRVQEGPTVAVQALADAFENVLAITGTDRGDVVAVGFDSPGPASADGVLSSQGSTNFSHPDWRNFDFRSALEDRLSLPVVYSNDTNAATLYAHHTHFGQESARSSSAGLIVGTGLGGGLVQDGRVIRGAAGMAGELGHVLVRMDGLLEDDQPIPICNCGQRGDAESVASLTGIRMNLLPYWLTRYPDHPLHALPIASAARHVRGLAENGDELAMHVFRQQAMALGRVFWTVANVSDPDAYFIGGGVVETAPHFRDWFITSVHDNMTLRAEQERTAHVGLVPDRDMAGARGAALAAFPTVPTPAAAVVG